MWFFQILFRQDECKTGDSNTCVDTWICRTEEEIRTKFIEWFMKESKYLSITEKKDNLREHSGEEDLEWSDYFTESGVPKFPDGIATAVCVLVHLLALGDNEGEYVDEIYSITGPIYMEDGQSYYF